MPIARVCGEMGATEGVSIGNGLREAGERAGRGDREGQLGGGAH